MAMDVIELDCPSCGEALELDAAFAGGVCRCSSCGTMMTVPADPSQGRAETLSRPDRPDAPAGRPDAPSARPEAPGGRPDAPAALPDSRAPARAAPPPPGSAESNELFVTESGRQVHVGGARVPTARRRRKVIRATVIGGFVVFCAAIIAVIIIMINLLFGEKTTDNAGAPKGPDPAKNPLEADEANLLTLPLGNDVAVVFEISSMTDEWDAMMRDVIIEAVRRSPDRKFKIIVYNKFGTKSFRPDRPAAIPADKLPDLRAFLDGFTNVGVEKPFDAVQMALDVQADQIILINPRVLDDADIDKLREMISKRTDTRFDAIVVDYHDPGQESLASEFKGNYVSLKLDLLKSWYRQWKPPS